MIEGKRIIVAGGTGGIGGAIARLAAQRGARVVILARDEAKIRDAVASIGQAQGQAADLSSDDGARTAFDRLGAFDFLATPVGGGGASRTGASRRSSPTGTTRRSTASSAARSRPRATSGRNKPCRRTDSGCSQSPPR